MDKRGLNERDGNCRTSSLNIDIKQYINTVIWLITAFEKGLLEDQDRH
jgi:hypothetical protein